jgi:hypothetical protein
MNAMLDPRIVAVRIQGPRDFWHGAVAAFAQTKLSSDGCLKEIAIVEDPASRNNSVSAKTKVALEESSTCSRSRNSCDP